MYRNFGISPMKDEDKTVEGGVLPEVKVVAEKKKPKENMHRRKIDADITEDNQKLCSKFAESSRYIVRESILRNALINERRTQN